ncbi:MAG: hypothetical protein II418_04100, partial [Firmicutes bacterium]|nr:hypothetical protein [Bacillota bacterium]
MKHLQYSFLIDRAGDLFPCDTASEEFLAGIDPDDFQAHVQSLELNNANLATTILLNHTSYTLRLVPVSAVRSAAQAKILDNWNGAYIAVLQDLVSLSSVLYTL